MVLNHCTYPRYLIGQRVSAHATLKRKFCDLGPPRSRDSDDCNSRSSPLFAALSAIHRVDSPCITLSIRSRSAPPKAW